MAVRTRARPILSVMTNVASDLSYLIQTEFRLARAEFGEKLSEISNAAILVGVGAALALSGLIVLLFCIATWMSFWGLFYGWALLIVSLVAIGLGGTAAYIGVTKARSAELIPERTLDQVREDYAVAKEHMG